MYIKAYFWAPFLRCFKSLEFYKAAIFILFILTKNAFKEKKNEFLSVSM